ncbi:hypothetical protein YPPY15_3230 [Yersinia pestis PY-15]|nr:hypothetical protein YpF1991016_3666 [Yersinia pestis biovar Orientalis str. F1991016]EDR62661.1 hypothetical protein YpUG050454_1558 [Yersinia pestis biovar Antiqua str. UG05-0454]EIR45469.1 hypothetical protein YPPY15_3230 [Yersinia pestis PY-15]EIS75254.1 hypothetical protein YPPY71_3063 [Yersinia pestis PY-71]
MAYGDTLNIGVGAFDVSLITVFIERNTYALAAVFTTSRTNTAKRLHKIGLGYQ